MESRAHRLARVSFTVGPEAYDRFMGRYSAPLAERFADFAGVGRATRVLDVGCGPGALTGELIRRLGERAVTAVDPSERFVEAVWARYPAVAAQRAFAEKLPFADRSFDAALAQLVVHFMADPVAGLREMLRVTEPGGIVAACVWDHAGGRGGPLGPFWEAARELDPSTTDESGMAGVRQGHLAELLRAAGGHGVEEGALVVDVEYARFEDWWEPYLLGVGPAGAYVGRLDDARRDRLRERCRDKLEPAPFTISARAWVARGRPQ